MISKDISISKYIETEITPRVNVTDEAMRSFYNENSEQMKRPEQAKLSHILIQTEPGASSSAKGEAKAKAEGLHDRIVAGEDFATLANEFSDDPGSKSRGGDLSWVARGQTVPAFEEAAFALMPGEVSGVVETQFGYHIIMLDERRPSQTVPFEEAKPQIVEFLRQQLLQVEMLSEVEALKAKTKVEILI
jgi:peptidyl-prolyl cis-trans isomerase C